MLIVMLSLGMTDIMFALDSIPAIFGSPRSPTWSSPPTSSRSWACASSTSCIGGLLRRLIYLSLGLAFILAWIGVKLIIHALTRDRLGGATLLSLGVIIVTLTITAVLSLLKTIDEEEDALAVSRSSAGNTTGTLTTRRPTPRPTLPSATRTDADRRAGMLVATMVAAPSTRRPIATAHRVVGTGTPASCTSAAVVKAVAAGGTITFDCGPDPVIIVMKQTAKVVNTNPVTVIDGGGMVTLSGDGKRRILYQNTCDPAQVWTTDHCQDQKDPLLVLTGLTFSRGNSTGELEEGGGGGAVFVRGGRLRVQDSVFDRNRCDRTGPDLGGAAIRVLSVTSAVKVKGSTFTRGRCSNGSALSSIGVSWKIRDSVFQRNKAVGGAPTRPGRAPPAAAAAARSTSTATSSPCV